jgi:hypothetical protein
MFVSIIVIIQPLLSGKTVYSELKSFPFDTPTSIPLKGDFIPGSLAQFFGRKISPNIPMFDIEKFVEQFHQIEVYGATACF